MEDIGKLGYHMFPALLTMFLYFKKILIYFWERETEREQARAEREDTESKAGSRLCAVSTEPDVGLELTNCEIMTCAEVGCSTWDKASVWLSIWYWLRSCSHGSWAWALLWAPQCRACVGFSLSLFLFVPVGLSFSLPLSLCFSLTCALSVSQKKKKKKRERERERGMWTLGLK